MHDTDQRMSQPEAMKTNAYVAGVEKLNGDDAWAMFKACAAGDMPKVKALLAKDRRLVNAQIDYYQFPDPHGGACWIQQKSSSCCWTRGRRRISWGQSLLTARERGHRQIEELLLRAMSKRFNYSPEFDELKDAIIIRDSRKIGAVLRRQPNLAQASDAGGNNALHWSVITRQLELIERFAALGTPIDAERADGFTPVLLAVNGGCNSYRAARDRSHPSIRSMFVIVGYLLARGAKYTISVAAAVGDQERVEQLLPRIPAWPGGSTRFEKARCPTRPREAICISSASCSSTAPIRIFQRVTLPTAWPSIWLARAITWRSPGCCWSTGPIPTRASIRACTVSISPGCTTANRRNRSSSSCASHGAYTQPYHMTVREMKQAIRDGHEVTRHPEFLGNLMAKRNPKLLDLYLDSDPIGIDRMADELACPWSAALVRKLLARGLDPNRPDWLGKTFLHACAASGNRSIAAVVSRCRRRHQRQRPRIQRNAAWPRPFVPGSATKSPSWQSAGDGWSSSCSSAVPRPTCPTTNRGRLPWPGHGNSDWQISKRFCLSTGLQDSYEVIIRAYGNENGGPMTAVGCGCSTRGGKQRCQVPAKQTCQGKQRCQILLTS